MSGPVILRHPKTRSTFNTFLATAPDPIASWICTILFYIRVGLCFLLPLALNVLQAFFYPLRYVSVRSHRIIETFIMSTFTPVSLYFFEEWPSIDVWFYGSKKFWEDPAPKNAIFISNHTSYCDWTVFFLIGQRKKFAQHIRIFIKDVAKYIPGMGWACWFHEMLFLRRNFQQDGHRIESAIKSFKRTGNPIWVTLFPEGTFIDDKNFHMVKASEDFARSKGLTPYEYVVTPRVKGFNLTVIALQEYATDIVDVTIAFKGARNPAAVQYCTFLKIGDHEHRMLPALTDLLNPKRACKEVHAHIRTFPLSEVPTNLDECERWLFQRFQEKNDMLKYFHENGAFPGEKFQIPVSRISLHLHFLLYCCLFVGFVWALKTLPGLYLESIVAGAFVFIVIAFLVHLVISSQ